MRHASEREKLIDEANGTVTLPWTFSSLTELMKKGQYDDLTRKPISNPTRNELRGRSRSRAREERRALPHEQPPGFAEDSDEELIEDPSSRKRPISPDPESRQASLLPVDEVDLDRLLCDPSYMPLSSVPTGPDPEPDRAEFLAKRAAHQISERPLHVRKQPSSSSQALYLATEEDLDSCVFGVTIPTPSDEREWRKILKDPKKFTAKSVQKGAEVSWGRLDPTQRKAMAEAKQLEVDQWVTRKVCQALSEKIPAERLMRMRWVLTFKGTENEHEVKAKARIVLLGYSDPDLEELMTSAPTLSRRGRQLLLNLGTFKRWTRRKADAKSAFLQGSESQRTRDIYAIPVPELATALQIPVGQAVKLLKAAYGLASAPREWYLDVAHVLEQDCGMSRLRCEQCIWVLRDQGRTIGVIGSHVDDFLIMGDESHPKWLASLEKFRSSFSWSPWEETPFVHCGVGITQTPDFGFKLDHSAYCTELKQVVIDERVPEITEGERSQCKALLGAVQWRAIQTAPQHCAKLSWLQSALPHGNKDTVRHINKLCREVYQCRGLSVSVQPLGATIEEDLVMVGWSDAAVGNRPDMTSTGGHVIALAHRSLLQGVRGPVNLVSWKSGKLHRVARSSLSAEIQALSEAEQELMFCRALWADFLGHELNPRCPEDTTSKVTAALVIDAKSVYDAFWKGDTASAAYSMKEKYAALELMSVTESMWRQNTSLLWVSSEAQLADGLTKSQAQDALRLFLQKGQLWNVKFDPDFVAAKKKKKQVPPNEDTFDGEDYSDLTWRDLLNGPEFR